MTFAECANKSVNNLIVLIELDILIPNAQWINNGSGIWVCNFNNSYPWVDASLLDGFTTQDFGDIGSVTSNDVSLQQVFTLVGLLPGTFYYDSVNKDLYVCNFNYDSPYICNIQIGEIHGFSKTSFKPLNSISVYDNRIINLPSIGVTRDPLFFGKLSYSDVSFNINNSDGQYDTFAEDNNIYGNPARVKIGFKEISITEYKIIFTGYVGGNVGTSETEVNFTISDKRKQLTKSINYSCTNKNALLAIEEMITQGYNYAYNSVIYNTTNWDLSKALVNNISIDTQSATSVIDLIELICKSTFGIFSVDADGRFNFSIIDDSKAATEKIEFNDMLNTFDISYDPEKVISSTNIGYNKNWGSSGDSAYTWLNDTGYERSVYDKYKVYTEKKVETILPDLASAQLFSDEIMEYNKDIHGTFPSTIPIKYYEVETGNTVLIEVDRVNKSMLHMRKCEVLNKTYNLESGLIELSLRLIKEMFVRITIDGKIRVTTDGKVRIA